MPLLPEAPAMAADVMMEPPEPMTTLATGDVVTTDEPAESVVVMTTPGTREELIMVEP